MPEPIRRVTLTDRLLAFAVEGRRAFRNAGDPEPRTNQPGEPLDPVHEDAAPRSQVPATGANLVLEPRIVSGKQLTSFEILRALADFDLVRIAIEDVRNQILGMEWEIGPKDEFKDDESLADVCARVKLVMERPDPLADLDFRTWLGRVLEEVLVTDALALYPRFDRAGRPIGLEQIDGATIKPLVDERGRPPVPPAPAYQQIIDGLPETEFTLPIGEAGRGELWYLPRNRRPDTPYGRSPTEQVLMTVNLALRSHTHDLSYFTHGTIPEMLKDAPAEWGPEQLRIYQQNFDDYLSGNSQRRSGVIFTPAGTSHNPKDRKWEYEFYEWLARVIAWSFGVSPLPIAKVLNRATAEQHESSALEAGPRPLADFIATVLNRFIHRVLEEDRIEFRWGSDETEDPSVVYQRNIAYVGAGIRSIDDVRVEIGEEPLGVGPMIQTSNGPRFVEDLVREAEERRKNPEAFLPPGNERDPNQPPDGPPNPGGDDEEGEDDESDPDPARKAWCDALNGYAAQVREDLVKLRKVLKKSRRRPFASSVLCPDTREAVAAGTHPAVKGELQLPGKVQDAAERMERTLLTWFEVLLVEIIPWAESQLPAGKLAKGLTPAQAFRNRHRPLSKVDEPDWDKQIQALFELLAITLELAAEAGSDDVTGAMGLELNAPPEVALQWARERAAEMVGRRWIAGQLVDNPDARWAVTDAVRQDVREIVARGVDQGWSPQRLGRELRNSLGRARANTVARSETADAYSQGAIETYRNAGVRYVKILDGSGCLPDGHRDGADPPSGTLGEVEFDREANGQIWSVDQFERLKRGHPNCVRAAVPHFPAS